MNLGKGRLTPENNFADAMEDIDESQYYYNSEYYEYFEGIHARIHHIMCSQRYATEPFERIDLHLDWKHFLHCVTIIRE